MSLRLLAAALCLAALSACGNIDSGPYASPEEAARAAYRHDGPPALTFYTMVSNRNGSGAHSSVMINASQRVIFDPSGSVQFAATPEIDDVLFGVTPAVAEAYKWAHARETYHLRMQRIEVPAAVAERALQLAIANGPVAQTQCTAALSGIVAQLPGFESIRPTLWPNAFADQLAEIPGMTEELVYDDDVDDKSVAVDAFDRTGAVR